MSEKVKARQEALRNRLIESAERQIIEQGRTGLRARVLAQEAGCSVGSIYFLFTDLDALVAEVNQRSLQALQGALATTRAALTDAGVEDRLVGLAQSYARFAAAHRYLWLALMTPLDTVDGSDPQFDAVVQGMVAAFAAELEDGSERSRRVLSETLFAAIHGVVLLSQTQSRIPSVERIEAELDLLVRQFNLSAALEEGRVSA